MHQTIPLAHLNIQGVNCAIFDADASSHSNQARRDLLARLTVRAQAAGLAVSNWALAFRQNGRLTFYGDDDLVRYLSNNPGALRWTHEIQA